MLVRSGARKARFEPESTHPLLTKPVATRELWRENRSQAELKGIIDIVVHGAGRCLAGSTMAGHGHRILLDTLTASSVLDLVVSSLAHPTHL